MALDKSTTAAIIGAILGPIAGLIGTKLKAIAEKRDAKSRAKELVNEATDLLGFADTLHKSASAGGLVVNVPSSLLQSLETTVAHRIADAIAAVSTVDISPAQKPARTVLDRVLLMHRPSVWWGWPLHVLYYVSSGIVLVSIPIIITDYRTGAADREGGVVIGVFFAFLSAVINVLCGAIAKRYSKREKTSAPTFGKPRM